MSTTSLPLSPRETGLTRTGPPSSECATVPTVRGRSSPAIIPLAPNTETARRRLEDGSRADDAPEARPHPRRDGGRGVDRRARAGRHLPRLGARGPSPAASSGVTQGATAPSQARGLPQDHHAPDDGDTTTQRPATASPATAPRRTLTIAAGGDVIGDRDVGTFIDENGGEAVLAGVAPLLRESQVAFVNLESPLSNKGARNTEKDVTFRGRPALVQGLDAAGVDVVSLANNHALDWGSKALLDTVARLDAAGIAHAGAGSDLDAARAPALLKTSLGHRRGSGLLADPARRVSPPAPTARG